jgi:hypothetical protein
MQERILWTDKANRLPATDQQAEKQPLGRDRGGDLIGSLIALHRLSDPGAR